MLACYIVPILFVTCFICASTANFTCAYRCDRCGGFIEHLKNVWYHINGSGYCLQRTEVQPQFFDYNLGCGISEAMAIRDAETCAAVVPRDAKGSADMNIGSFSYTFKQDTGCRVRVTNAHWIGLDVVEATACFGGTFWRVILLTQLIAVIIGIILGIISSWFQRKPHSKFIDNLANIDRFRKYSDDQHGEDQELQAFPAAPLTSRITPRSPRAGLFAWQPGSRMVAKNTLVPSHRIRYIECYRVMQVIANVWLPMLALWFFSPFITCPLYLIFYVIPAIVFHGFDVLSQPRFFVTQGTISLLGIEVNATTQMQNTWRYLFQLIRPPIFVATAYGVLRLIVYISLKQGHDSVTVASWLTNSGAYWRIVTQNWWGDVLTLFTIITTLVGTCAFMAMTVMPVVRGLREQPVKDEWVTLDIDDVLTDRFNRKVDEISLAASLDVLEEDEDRVNDLHVETLSLRDVYIVLALAVIDFFSYIYKVFTFLRDNRFILAGVMTVALAEAITTLWYHGHLAHFRKALQNTITSGLPSVHFLALCQWDDGLAGIPALALSVYGLPLARPRWYSALMSVFFLMTGTRALAVYLANTTDAAMFEEVEDNSDDDDDDDGSTSEEDISGRICGPARTLIRTNTE